jgi:NADH-quinone oxidoreductase subunit H
MQWIAYLQPVALLLWVNCTAPPTLDPQASARIPGRLQALNYDLLTSALFIGGWQGPFVERVPWLGLVYSALKIGLLAFLRTWIGASLPISRLRVHSRRIWVWCTPLSALNLLITAIYVALR